MATRIGSHLWPPGRGKYPWDEWLDGSAWQLTPGEDFTVEARSFCAAARAAALRHGGSLRTRSADGHVILQFLPGDKP